MSVNVKSVITSGLSAGLLISLSALTMVPVVGNEMNDVLAARGLPPLSVAAMIFFCSLSFINGIALIWLYAFVRKPSSSKIKTAMLVSFLFWFIAYLPANISLVAYGFMPVRLTVIGTLWGLGELLLAGLAGSWMYKES